ncbi:MAG: serine/threonine-protein phosphatase [Clostridia bacterium]|nr:serine/threonine-protein phosphatase [Clostridia bacterium]
MRSTDTQHHESAENSILQMTATMVIGDREDQQDSFGYEILPEEAVLTVCDGMGGHIGGQEASQTAVTTILDGYLANRSEEDEAIPPLLRDLAMDADEAVCALTDENGNLLQAGSTMLLLVLRGNRMYWNSVGDSRIYLLRGGECVQITKDQNYETVLNEQLRAGQITREFYEKEMPKGSALVNYLGLGNIATIDYNETPFLLKAEDRILMASDGLYRLVTDEEIRNILDNFRNIEDAVAVLESKAKRAAMEKHVSRDNMTTVLIKIKESKE